MSALTRASQGLRTLEVQARAQRIADKIPHIKKLYRSKKLMQQEDELRASLYTFRALFSTAGDTGEWRGVFVGGHKLYF